MSLFELHFVIEYATETILRRSKSISNEYMKMPVLKFHFGLVLLRAEGIPAVHHAFDLSLGEFSSAVAKNH